MKPVTYTSYGRRAGFTPLPDKTQEFERLSKELFDVNAESRYHAFHDPDGTFNEIQERKKSILDQLAAVSKPKRTRR